MADVNNEDIINFIDEPFIDLTFSHIDCKHSIFSSESLLLDNLIGKVYLFFIVKIKDFYFIH
jgi:hypothetical protein